MFAEYREDSRLHELYTKIEVVLGVDDIELHLYDQVFVVPVDK